MLGSPTVSDEAEFLHHFYQLVVFWSVWDELMRGTWEDFCTELMYGL